MYILKQIPEDFIVEEIFNTFGLKKDGKFFYYNLIKKGLNTIYAIELLKKEFNAEVNFAGNKDRNAITSQTISSNKKIPEFENENLKLVYLGNNNNKIHLGENLGNKFTITIRNLTLQEAEFIKNKIKNNKDIKYINYFGLQRFGKNNLKIAISILKRDFKTAVENIDFKKVQKHIENNPEDFNGALKQLPKKLLNLIINSYQSHLWNLCAEKFEDEFIPVIGFSTEFNNSNIEKYVDEILKKDGLNLRSFIIREIPNALTEGDIRKRITLAKYITLIEKDDDELNNGMKKVKISFELEKGSFATIFIEQLFD